MSGGWRKAARDIEETREEIVWRRLGAVRIWRTPAYDALDMVTGAEHWNCVTSWLSPFNHHQRAGYADAAISLALSEAHRP